MRWAIWTVFFVQSCCTVNAQSNQRIKTNPNCICIPYWRCEHENIVEVRFAAEQTGEIRCEGDFDVCCPIECGKLYNGLGLQPIQLKSRILDSGSKQASFAEFPWMLGILQDKMFKCSASLIHPQVALTAAHCVLQNDIYKVRAGELNWDNQEEPVKHQDRNTYKIIIHPNYHAPSLANDIAILILDAPFEILENVGIVCLPSQQPQFENRMCTTSGWGKNSYKKGTYQSTLKKIDLPIVPSNDCLWMLRKSRLGPYFKLHWSFMCAGGEEGVDACKGDGGSPLICPIYGNQHRYEQVGIVSWGLQCGVQNIPGVYVNVGVFTHWIDQEMIQHNFDTNVYKS